MEQVIKLLNNCLLNYLNQKVHRGIHCFSPIQGGEPGWYIWLLDYPGVYDLQLMSWWQENDAEKSIFRLRYYPSLDDEAFDRLSCKEQITRLSEYFDNTLIKEHEHSEGCPCSQLLGEHGEEGEHKRIAKGIPRCFHRQKINPDLFTIAEIEFLIFEDKLLEMTLKSQDYLRLYSISGISIDKQGQLVELVAPGGIDRDFLGWTVSWHFIEILVKEVFGKLGYYSTECSREIEPGVVCYEDRGGVIWEEKEPSVTRIAHKFCF